MEFWLESELDFSDSLNVEIWAQSPTLQEKIQGYRQEWGLGEVGAQQAMRFPFRLPWVPDIVGREADKSSALLIVGSAYGAFIGGDGRQHELAASEYACETSAQFGVAFFKKVIRQRAYYRAVGELALTVITSCRLLALFDICRVAFVERAIRRDKGGDGVVKNAPELFAQYVESPTASGWLWRRIVTSEATTIVALGTIAEHGLLRLFARNLVDVRITDSVDPNIVFSSDNAASRWPLAYAHRGRQIQDRAISSSPPFWRVRGAVAGGPHRVWHVAVVTHPTGSYVTYPGYSAQAVRAAYHSVPPN